ncbi:hypothetical protein FRC0485_00194 [Corynebacterium diphtheriae]|nr:hypothetical protein FRC0485_00194 [Corynebacterium diphtheriae]
MFELGFLFVLGARWRPFSRLLELKNTKTAGSENLLKVPPLGFRVLEFEFADFGG